MTYTLRYRPGLKDEILKFLRNDPVRFEQLTKKIEYLVEHPEMGKPLRNRLKGKWRVHIGPYVLLYKIDLSQNCIVFRLGHNLLNMVKYPQIAEICFKSL